MGSNRDQDQTTSRRGFLKMAGVSAPAAIAAATVAGGANEASADEVRSGGLQDTEHTRAYFDSARF